MATIGERVKYAIDHMERGEIHAALEHACNAVDVTSQRYYGKSCSSRSIFKSLITEYIWLIESMAMGGINLDETVFENFTISEGVKKPITRPKFSDLLYHVVRCGLVHSDKLSDGFAFHNSNTLLLEHEKITFPSKIVYGLLSIVVFCPANKEESTQPGYWIGFHANRLVINDFWGNEDIIRKLTSNYPVPRVAIKELNNLCPDEAK